MLKRLQTVILTAQLASWFLLPGCMLNPLDDDQEYQPYEWEISRPAEQGLDSLQLARAHTRALTIPEMRSLLVVRNGYLVAEHYYQGADENALWHTRSATKSVISALVGIAIEQGYIDSVDQRLSDLLPAYFNSETDSAKFDITVRHLLTMTAGLEWEENGLLQDQWYYSSNWLAFTISLPLESAPGTIFEYNSALPHLLSGIIAVQTGMNTSRYAEHFLFDSLGIVSYRWELSPEGVPMGGFGLYLTPRDMARFGQLYVEGGQVDGRQILSDEWVRDSMRKHVVPGIATADGYGYLWWKKPFEFIKNCVAIGAGGQMIYCFPNLRLVVVTTATFPGDAGYQVLDGLVEQYILAAVRD
ncbi:MAG: serine hydrolase [Fidelibacterota bacterium]|nr:MAG: serine hydrolase [Candidatus Neomarinimicrobiota bacterium]